MFIVGLVCFIFALNLFGSANPTIQERALASLIIVACAVPSWLWLSGHDRALPFMPFFGMVFTVYYAAPLFLLRDYTTAWSASPMPHAYVRASLDVGLAGLICVMAGYYGPIASIAGGVLLRPKMKWARLANVKLNGLVFCIAGLALFVIERAVLMPLSLVQLFTFASDLCLVGACILFALQLTGGIGFLTSLFLWGFVVPVRLWMGFGIGLTSEGLTAALLLIFTYASIRHRLPWPIMIVGGLAFCIIRPAEQGFRALTWQGGTMEDAPVSSKSAVLANIIRGTLSESISEGGGATGDLVQFTMRRLGTDTLTLADVLHDTPRMVPYWNGASYYPLVFKLLPRALFPAKPEEVTGQTFGHRYGLLRQNNFETSYNLPQLVEGYVNFGIPGVIVSALLFGILYRLVQIVFVHRNMGFGALISGIYVSVKLLQIESATSLVIGDIIWTLIFMAIVSCIIQWADHTITSPASA